MLLNIIIQSSAYALDYKPYISLAEFYTDNLFLLPDEDDLKQSDWVTQIKPGIRLHHESTRILFDLDYAYQYLWYKDNDKFNEGYNQLNSSAWFDLLTDELRLYAAAVASQVNVSPARDLANTNIPITGNRTSANTLTVGPQWTRRLFQRSDIDAYAYIGKASFDAPDTQDIVPFRLGVALKPNELAGRTRFRTNYQYVSLDYEISGTIKDQELNAEIARNINESIALTALVGAESNLNDPFDAAMNEFRWEVGFDYFGSGENSLSAGIGHRYFGTNYRVGWLNASPKRRFTLSYKENPANSDYLDLAQIPTEPTVEGAPPPVPDPDSGLNRRGAPGRFINKRFDTSLSFTGYKTGLTLAAYYDDRVSLIDEIPDLDSIGVGLDFTRQLGVKTDFSTGLSWLKRQAFFVDPDTGLQIPQGDLENFGASVALSRLFGRATTVTFEGNYNTQDNPNNRLQDYNAVLIMLSWTRTFGTDRT